jgi:hypothetical protein
LAARTGAIKVRKVKGLDGREKLQLRIDLGLLQMEMDGRPDGQRPHNCESYLVYHQRRAIRAAERGEEYELTSEQCGELQQEGIQYYHRYLSLFQIDEFEGVIRDTQRNLTCSLSSMNTATAKSWSGVSSSFAPTS